MKIVIEVVATNMDTGHVAVHQTSVDVDLSQVPPSKQSEYLQMIKKDISETNKTGATKVGPILINRNYTFIV